MFSQVTLTTTLLKAFIMVSMLLISYKVSSDLLISSRLQCSAMVSKTTNRRRDWVESHSVLVVVQTPVGHI